MTRYQTGFCPNGPICFFTHTKQHGYRPQVTDIVRFVLDAYQSDVQQLPPAEPSQQYQAVSEASQQSYRGITVGFIDCWLSLSIC